MKNSFLLVLSLLVCTVATAAENPFLKPVAPVATDAPPAPSIEESLESDLRTRIMMGELRYRGAVNNRDVYFDEILRKFIYIASAKTNEWNLSE